MLMRSYPRRAPHGQLAPSHHDGGNRGVAETTSAKHLVCSGPDVQAEVDDDPSSEGDDQKQCDRRQLAGGQGLPTRARLEARWRHQPRHAIRAQWLVHVKRACSDAAAHRQHGTRRWMANDLGEPYVWNNVPEFAVNVVKNGQVVHAEKIIVGKRGTPTPIFSAKMEFIVFHPEWNVPDSIKVTELWPYLAQGSGWYGGADISILRRQNLM
jgi:hypothetical protein